MKAYDFSGKKVMDVGGGYGELLAQVLIAYPTAHGVLFDMAHAISKARDAFTERGLAAAMRVRRRRLSRASRAARMCTC